MERKRSRSRGINSKAMIQVAMSCIPSLTLVLVETPRLILN